MIKVLIAEDSRVVEKTLIALLTEEPGIEIVGVAHTGFEAVEKCRRLRPDLVTMDVHMPEMDGLEATRLILSAMPTRVVIISSAVDVERLAASFDAIRNGAVDVIEKPQGVLLGDYREVKRALIQRVREIAAANPTNHLAWIASRQSLQPNRGLSNPPILSGRPVQTASVDLINDTFYPELIGIGGSTGAPAVIGAILSALSREYPIPVVVAQHISKGFVEGMALWLNRTVQVEVKVAETGDSLKAGRVLMAPDRAHLEVRKDRLVFVREPEPEDIHIPSIDRLFFSIAEVYGGRSLGVILSGMGKDGTKGLLKMRKAGAVTVAQSKSSSLIYGMPAVATAIGAASQEMSPLEIGELLNRFAPAPALVGIAAAKPGVKK
jgi:two-component system, chemotaxis family, protein-glutamate methylesterase/glutaminase